MKRTMPFQKRLPPSERKFRRFAADLDAQRPCGDCTACCDAIAVEEIHKPEFTPCKHLCGTGCQIYKNRPGQCRDYMCAWKAEWTPNDESWRPDHLGVIFDIHDQGMSGVPAVRCWQMRSDTQILDDPLVRKMAYALAVQLKNPVVARYGNTLNISVHLISQLDWIRIKLGSITKVEDGLPVPVYLLTPNVIEDPQDFDREREIFPKSEMDEIVNQFGPKASVLKY